MYVAVLDTKRGQSLWYAQAEVVYHDINDSAYLV